MNSKLAKAGQRVDAVLDFISDVLEVIAIVTGVGLIVVLAGQTILSWFSISVLWSDEIATLLCIWLVFTGAAVMTHEKKHVVVDFLTQKLPEPVQLLLDAVITLLAMWVCIRIVHSGFVYIEGTQNIRTQILKLPMAALYCAPIISVAYMFVFFAADICRKLVAAFTGRHLPDCGGEEGQGK